MLKNHRNILSLMRPLVKPIRNALTGISDVAAFSKRKIIAHNISHFCILLSGTVLLMIPACPVIKKRSAGIKPNRSFFLYIRNIIFHAILVGLLADCFVTYGNGDFILITIRKFQCSGKVVFFTSAQCVLYTADDEASQA